MKEASQMSLPHNHNNDNNDQRVQEIDEATVEDILKAMREVDDNPEPAPITSPNTYSQTPMGSPVQTYKPLTSSPLSSTVSSGLDDSSMSSASNDGEALRVKANLRDFGVGHSLYLYDDGVLELARQWRGRHFRNATIKYKERGHPEVKRQAKWWNGIKMEVENRKLERERKADELAKEALRNEDATARPRTAAQTLLSLARMCVDQDYATDRKENGAESAAQTKKPEGALSTKNIYINRISLPAAPRNSGIPDVVLSGNGELAEFTPNAAASLHSTTEKRKRSRSLANTNPLPDSTKITSAERSTKRQRHVRLSVPDDHPEEHHYRPSNTFYRPSPVYEPGRHSDTTGEGFLDTSNTENEYARRRKGNAREILDRWTNVWEPRLNKRMRSEVQHSHNEKQIKEAKKKREVGGEGNKEDLHAETASASDNADGWVFSGCETPVPPVEHAADGAALVATDGMESNTNREIEMKEVEANSQVSTSDYGESIERTGNAPKEVEVSSTSLFGITEHKDHSGTGVLFARNPPDNPLTPQKPASQNRPESPILREKVEDKLERL